MARNTYNYVMDDGETVVIELDEFYGTQAGLGFVAATESDPPRHHNNRGFKPRRALVVTAAGVRRQVPCGTATASAYATTNVALNIRVAGATTAARTYGWEGEQRRNDIRKAVFA